MCVGLTILGIWFLSFTSCYPFFEFLLWDNKEKSHKNLNILQVFPGPTDSISKMLLHVWPIVLYFLDLTLQISQGEGDPQFLNYMFLPLPNFVFFENNTDLKEMLNNSTSLPYIDLSLILLHSLSSLGQTNPISYWPVYFM